MEETVDHDVLRPAPGKESPDGRSVRTENDPVLLDRVFGRDDIAVVRHEINGRLDPGLLGDRQHGFVLAINEIITNVVLHAGGHGRIVLSRPPGAVWCTVTDSGPGIPEQFRRPPETPEVFEVGGRGIWLAYQLCDEVTMATGPIGTTIGLKLDVPTVHTTNALVNGVKTTG